MALSYQEVVSDGALQDIVISFPYFNAADVHVFVNGEDIDTTTYTWSWFNSTTVRISPVVPASVVVRVYRRTSISTMYNVYSQNAQFDAASIDENFKQLLFASQEYTEQGISDMQKEFDDQMKAQSEAFALAQLNRNTAFNTQINRQESEHDAQIAAHESEHDYQITEHTQKFQHVLYSMGWAPVTGSFEDGGTLTSTNNILLYKAGFGYYQWMGSLPKVVPAGSTPASTGGIGPSTWVYRSEGGVRTQLSTVLSEIVATGGFTNSDYNSARAWGLIGDGAYHPLQELVDSGKFSGLTAIQVAYPKVTSLAQSIDWAALQTAADYCRGSMLVIPKGRPIITQTVIIPKGTNVTGLGKYDPWEADVTCGTVIGTYGAGNPQRWTDIDGTDANDDTPMFVAGGPGVYFRNMALVSPNWSMGIHYPSVRQCGFSQLIAYGFTDACVYLDMTWSPRNTVMTALHPDIETDGGMNEFSGFDFYLRTDAPGSFAVKVQGTTRPGTATATADEWPWGYGGASDARISHGRLNGGGVGGGCFKHDAQLWGTSLAQGFSLRDVALRLHGSGDYYAYFDRSNRIIIDGSYGEHASGGVGKVSVTSRTAASVDGILFVNDRLGGRMYKDGVDRGSLQTPDWQDTRCVQMYKVAGRISTPNIKALDVAQAMEFTSWDTEYGFIFNLDDGTHRTQYYAMSSVNFRPQVNGINLGSSNHPWDTTYTYTVKSVLPSGKLSFDCTYSEYPDYADIRGIKGAVIRHGNTSMITAVGSTVHLNQGVLNFPDFAHLKCGATYTYAFDIGSVEQLTISETRTHITSGVLATTAGELDLRAGNGFGVRLRSGTNTALLANSSELVTSGDVCSIRPSTDNTVPICTGSRRATTIYLGTAPNVTSDADQKRDIAPITDAALDAWESVSTKQYLLVDGTSNRVHTGFIVQHILAAFTAKGLDAQDYGLCCYESWLDKPATVDEDGTVLEVAREAGGIWTLRYDEAYAFEAAYQRRRADRMEARLLALEAKIGS